jgi:hypothetical protein
MSPTEDERYFAHRAQESHDPYDAAKDRGSRVAHAQLALAYEARSRNRALVPGAVMIAEGALPK